ncbi:MAG: 16S rRNA (cytosine(1402)-N(4))-methyltransferase RsmH [Porticoccus sp.]|jgi:16S rRNA (cytosine1402-N4)-methyltransferase|uniref:16S rRNA (cytosine(1402)-N(4))-methyltransferase RsmH n=1 Tax=Porticoccus sp. Uisw_050_02 TaxID=3230978 RepID=UPI0030A6755C|tara:strand:+ start:1115 stop:2050 length:936 start_codon:yes stop_codon:yes gene_type:complete
MSVEVGHKAVLLKEAVEALITNPDGLYIDGTFGRGGHAALILSQLSETGSLMAVDKDPKACEVAKKKFSKDARFEIKQASFADIRKLITEKQHEGTVSGVLLDLGVSSPQIDDPIRGFSFLRDGPLDMRMNPSCGISAAEWLSTAKENDIAQVLKDYGEERYSKRIARAIAAARADKPITRTGQLAAIVKEANPAWEKDKHPATRAFQGIRIFINQELKDLESVLPDILEIMAVGGRLVIISFHSLEDRIVKRFIRDQEKGKAIPRGLPVMEKDIVRRLRSIGKIVKPSGLEIKDNVRARSAVMRIAEKLI